MIHELDLPVGLADSELEGYRRAGTEVIIEIYTWNEKKMSISFHDVIVLRDTLAGIFSNFVSNFPASDETLNEALAKNFESVPESHPYRVYSFLNLDGDPSLEVVASSYDVTVR